MTKLRENFTQITLSLPVLNPPMYSEVKLKNCPNCGTHMMIEAVVCNHCGHSESLNNLGMVSLQDTLLFFAILMLIALNIAPVWPANQIYGKVIQFLAWLGVLLPSSINEAARYREIMWNVITIYRSLNLIHYLIISVIIILFLLNWLKIRKQIPGFNKKVWVILGLLLLIFPIANLIISQHMFFSPGVFGTTVASFIILFAGLSK